MKIFKTFFNKFMGKSVNVEAAARSETDELILKEQNDRETYIELSRELVERMGAFRMKHSVYLRGETYNEKNAIQALPYLEELFDVFKELLSIKREYGQDADVDDYYVHNLANCYVSLGRYQQAYETLRYGFLNLKQEEIYNLNKSLEYYLKNCLLNGELGRFFSSYEELKTAIPENERKKFRRHIEKELSEYFENNIQSLNLKELDKEYGEIYIYKKIFSKVTENKKVYEIIEEAKNLYGKKEYEAAESKFAAAVDNANKLEIEIGKHYELYGDIYFKLENYDLARTAYEKSILDTSYKHRVYKKIGDTYKRENSDKNAFFAYLLSLASKTDYKTSQNMIEKLNFGHELKKILEFCAKNSNLEDGEFKKRAQKHFGMS